MKDIGPLVIIDILAADNILLDRRSTTLASLELILSIDPTRTILYLIGLNHLDPIPPNI